jgi:hypothetical protein
LKTVPSTDALHAAVAAASGCVVRWGEADPASDPTAARRRGWFRGADECARYLADRTGADLGTGVAFGGEWPILGNGGWLIAPAMPLVLVGTGGDAPDAAYLRRGDTILREAAGLETCFLTISEAAPPPGQPFDLLWFGDTERYVVRRGKLEVDDMFARLELPLDREWLEKHLVRGRRVDGGVLDDLAGGPPGGAATVTVHRQAALHPGKGWRDPERFLGARADIARTERRGGVLEAYTAHGANPRFESEVRDDGWTLVLQDGFYPLTALTVRHHTAWLSLTATLHPTVDPLRPGMRGRLAFDLRSDLVALGQS